MTLCASRRTELIRRVRDPRARSCQTRPPTSQARAPVTEGILIHTSLNIGKYLVSPLTRRDDDGHYVASVSIRSGRGSMTHDRVVRFLPLFDSDDQARRFATEQALAWIDSLSSVVHPSPTNLE